MENTSLTVARGLFLPLVLVHLFATSLSAESTLPREVSFPLALANEAAVAALGKCEKDGYQVSVAVVDRAGVLKVLLRGDGAGPHTTDSSRKKAYTAASLRRATGFFSDLVSKNPGLSGLRDMNENILILGGGFPIVIGGEVVGGIGVGGAPGADLDEACAMAGLSRIGATSNTSKKK